ncbi:MAG TPA: hypothetical protein VN939_22140 [Chthoniobacterales bacterium]|nr:hypothetical protein [Chthoniobacterales bacterium]
MDDFEATLCDAIDQFRVLQKWSEKPETSRHVTQVFPLILGLDKKLKVLERWTGCTRCCSSLERSEPWLIPESLIGAVVNWKVGRQKEYDVPGHRRLDQSLHDYIETAGHC